MRVGVGLVPQVNWPKRKGGHLPSVSAEARNAWRCASTPLTQLHGMGRASFTFINSKLKILQNLS